MFNLNENNRFVMAQHPSDMRIGVNGMCGQVRAVGLDPTNGDVYIFRGQQAFVTHHIAAVFPMKNSPQLPIVSHDDERIPV